MEKKVKCRKNYKCDHCGEIINKGEYSFCGSDRQPRFSDGDGDHEEQIGIEYISWRLHADVILCNSNE